MCNLIFFFLLLVLVSYFSHLLGIRGSQFLLQWPQFKKAVLYEYKEIPVY